MKQWKITYLMNWLNGFKHPRSFGVYQQGWLNTFEDFLAVTELELGKKYKFLMCNGVPFTAEVTGHYVSMAEFFCTREEYRDYDATGESPRNKYGKSRVIIWDFDKHDESVIGDPYQDLYKVYNHIKEKYSIEPVIHNSGGSDGGYHMIIYLPEYLDNQYKKAIEYFQIKTTRDAGVYVPTKEENRRTRSNYKGTDKIENPWWTVDRTVFKDVLTTRILRIPFIERTNGNTPIPIDINETPVHQCNRQTSDEMLLDIYEIHNQLEIATPTPQQIRRQELKFVPLDTPKGYTDFNTLTSKNIYEDLYGTNKQNRGQCPYGTHSGKTLPVTVSDKGVYCHGCQRPFNPWELAMIYYNDDKAKSTQYLKSMCQ